MARDYYEILGVERGADVNTIKKAYRQMALKFHPDRNPGDKSAEEKFKEAAEAYDVLSNQEKRMRYDRFGHAGMGGFNGGPQFHDVSDVFSAFGDIFSDFFGGGSPFGGNTRGARSRNRPRRGSDLRYILEIELKEVINGAQKEIQFDTEEHCKTCDGSGAKAGTKAETCGTCAGAGQVVRQQGFFTMATPCGTCRGEGQIIKEKCTKCNGRGRSPAKRKLSLNVPAGVDNGTQLRLSAEGEAGYFGAGPGDLFVEIRVEDDDRFERDGQTLHQEIQISYLQALLGAEIKVPTVTGHVEVEVPAGSEDETELRVRGEGLPSVRSATRGDMILHVKVNFPKKLSAKEEELLREIAEEKGEKVLSSKSFFGRRKS